MTDLYLTILSRFFQPFKHNQVKHRIYYKLFFYINTFRHLSASSFQLQKFLKNITKIIEYLFVFNRIQNKNVYLKKILTEKKIFILKNINLLLKLIKKNKKKVTACTKTRAETNFSNKKLWRQKKTGRARVGSKNSPLMRGGGTVFGPNKLKANYFKINKNLIKNFLFNLLLLFKNKIIFFTTNEPIHQYLSKKNSIKTKILIIIDKKKNYNILKKFTNYSMIKIFDYKNINIIDFINSKKIFIDNRIIGDFLFFLLNI